MGAVWSRGAAQAELEHRPIIKSLVDLERGRRQSPAAQKAAADFQAATLRQTDAPQASPAPLNVQEVPRFEPSNPLGLQYLIDHGYVVLQSVLDESEVNRAHDLLWEFLPGATGCSLPDVTGWQRGKMDTWGQLGFRFCGLAHWGIVKARGAGQSELVWYVRTRSIVKDVFAKIWGTDKLLSSFDGFNIFLPWHHLQNCKTQSGWLHTDQGSAKRGLHTIQGFVALTDQNATTGGLHVIPGSHHSHEDWVTADYSSLPHHDFCMVRPHGHGGALLHLPQQLVTCKAGDLVLWDSRCVHCNTPALEKPTTPEGELLRVAIYVCMNPKSLASEDDLSRRQKAYDLGLSSNHWPLFSEEEFDMFMGNGGGFQVKRLDDTDDDRRDLIC